MLHFTPFTPREFDRLTSWITTPVLLVTIAGHDFSFPLDDQQLQQYLRKPESLRFNIVDDNSRALIGHAELQQLGEGVVKLDKFIIGAPTERGKGYGKAALALLKDVAFHQLNAVRFELNVFDWNKNAIRCYEQSGFSFDPEKTRSFPFDGNDWTTLNMFILADNTQIHT